MNYLNENHVSECRIVKEGPDLTLPPVRFVVLKERGGVNAYTIPIVSCGKMMVSITDCKPMEIRVLIFRPGAFPCVDLMIDPAPHAAAKQARIDAKIKQHEERNGEKYPTRLSNLFLDPATLSLSLRILRLNGARPAPPKRSRWSLSDRQFRVFARSLAVTHPALYQSAESSATLTGSYGQLEWLSTPTSARQGSFGWRRCGFHAPPFGLTSPVLCAHPFLLQRVPGTLFACF